MTVAHFLALIAHFLALIALSAAGYRITRFTQLDSMFEGTRDRFFLWLETRSLTSEKPWRQQAWRKILDGASCAFCVSVWIAGFLVIFWAAATDYDLGWSSIVDWLAVATGTMLFYKAIDPPE